MLFSYEVIDVHRTGMISIISTRGEDKMKCILERFGRAKQTAFTLVSSVVSTIIVATIAVPAESKIEIAKLPPPITAYVDFAKDIKPLFENVCLKCHGPEHPSGAFRLDTREGALRGGQNGIDIIPGDSAQSPLIHFVARLIDGREMPPKGVGTPLGREQIGLFRAWIDQGATWPEGVTLQVLPTSGVPVNTGPTVEKTKDAVGTLPPSAAKKVEFVKDIQPIFARSCYACHGTALQRAGLRLDVKSIALKGSENGPVIIPGDSANSRLIHLVAGLNPSKIMPQAGDRLTAEQVGLLRAWIDQGAHWPHGLDPANTAGKRDHWAFKTPVRPSQPKLKNTKWVRTPIDVFIAAQHEKSGLVPAPEASRRVFIRRVFLDLTGLPPSPAEIESFLADTSSDAYERLVDKLLASPQYGVRWGRHWLDLARWAETEGYEANEWRSSAWRYRDYVVNAFNEDEPYDQFLREQIAGDEIVPYSDRNLIATGFLASGRLNNNEEDKAVQRNDMLVDLTNATASVTLGLTMNCAQCHDHKFDAITFRDYYSFQGFFVRGQVNRLLLKDPELWKSYEAAAQSDLEVVKSAKHLYELLYGPVRARLVEEATKKLAPELLEALNTRADKRSDKQIELAKKAEKEVEVSKDKLEKALAEDDRKFFKELDKKLTTLEKELEDKKPHTWGFYSPATSSNHVEALHPNGTYPLPYEPEKLKEAKPRLLKRGDVHEPGSEELEPGGPEILGAPSGGKTDKTPRLALTDWLISRTNPLVSRVWVNYIWQQHFGRGLVATPGDFGVRSSPPTHPELLDWLAMELMDSGWSTKHIHRLIVLSSTYRQAAQTNPENAKVDPENKYWWHWSPRRLEAEAIRDAVLAVSGELDPVLGGPSVSFGSSSAADGGELDATFAEQNLGSKQESLKPRRSIYMRQLRNNFPAMQKLFNGPSASESCPRRHVSTVALQPLYMLNNPFILKQAELFAARVFGNAGHDPLRQIQLAFVLALGRPAEKADIEAVRAFLETYKGAETLTQNGTNQDQERRAPALVGKALVGSATKGTTADGETADGTTKPKPPAVSQLTNENPKQPPRELVHLCQALLNLDEFFYLE
jgi:mono/diheme cytochrome c family protein